LPWGGSLLHNIAHRMFTSLQEKEKSAPWAQNIARPPGIVFCFKSFTSHPSEQHRSSKPLLPHRLDHTSSRRGRLDFTMSSSAARIHVPHSAAGFRLSSRDRALSEDRIKDHLDRGIKIYARLPKGQPKTFWNQAHFQQKRGASSRPPRVAVSCPACFVPGKR
jgi:hypothetical protein